MMAHRPASRHGRYDAFHTEFTTETPADELPSQSVFSYDGTEDVKQARENPTVHRQKSAHRKAMAHSVIPSGPVVAVHMFDVPSDHSDERETSPSQTSQLRRWSREALDGSDNFPPASPRPPATPRTSRPGSMRRRSRSGQRPSSNQSQRPLSSRQSTKDYSATQEELLPPMATLRPQSSLGKYHVLPDISNNSDSLLDCLGSSRSDGSEDQRGMKEMEYLTSKLAHQARVESARRNSRDGHAGPEFGAVKRKTSQEEKHHRNLQSENCRNTPTSQERRDSHSSPVLSSTPVNMGLRRASSTSSNMTTPEPVNERSHTSISQYNMDEAPKPSSEGQVLLGIKIPTNGTRYKHYFNSRDQLRCIVLFAEEVSGEDFSNHVPVLASPRRRFENLSATIEGAGLESKSVIHLEEID